LLGNKYLLLFIICDGLSSPLSGEGFACFAGQTKKVSQKRDLREELQ